jgi:uncharacterized membrane protein YphA (DoxX/SURF4 family)
MQVETALESQTFQSTRELWSPSSSIAFRFCFIYFTLYCVGTQIINSVLAVPKVDVPDWGTLWPVRPVIVWVASHLFGVKTTLVYSDSGSGDKTYDWVLAFCLFVLAVAATAIWSFLDRNRTNYSSLSKWFWLFLRLCLASQMLSYGLFKVFPVQMPFPYLSTQVEPFGSLSPMGILWASIGASPAYETFAGCAECLGGLLLIFPRTATLGAIVCLLDMVQVFALNMTYDVPVKLFSFHLILMSLFILAPDYRRLLNFLVLNRPAEPSARQPLFVSHRATRWASAAIAFLWLWIIFCSLFVIWDGWDKFGPGAAKSPLYGIWNIEQSTVDGQAHPLLVTDNDGWRRLIFDSPQRISVMRMNDSRTGYAAAIDSGKKTLALTSDKDKNWKADFVFARPTPDTLTLDGTMDGHRQHLELSRLDHSKFLFAARGFHWIQEYPFNR